MKQTTKMSRAVSQLEHIYNTLNADFYENSLPVPIITVQSKPGTYGHCSNAKVWQRPDGGAYELNISAEVLNFPIEETLDTMLHEMVHLFCHINKIRETSKNGFYHNGNFKREAERVGLRCFKTPKYGWNTTATGNDRLIEYALQKNWNEIMIGRNNFEFSVRIGNGATISGSGTVHGERRPSSTRKLVCPCCGATVRATKAGLNIICGDCNEQMEYI